MISVHNKNKSLEKGRSLQPSFFLSRGSLIEVSLSQCPDIGWVTKRCRHSVRNLFVGYSLRTEGPIFPIGFAATGALASS